ncbi:DUF5304 family protein [Yinghuangia soli]|uniref:DUF5304 domain-containing protein n=1 Tax=Yinghuangia soli TaxID=2908204 RepID=A0AA41Q478_9ACTN|nr:DUF5304 family protein [Yinghuangia soli]MCF2531243.1 DUF5304 domain-containing protein [Yinghuangia soli]
MKTTDGPDDPWTGVADPIPGARTEPGPDESGAREHPQDGDRREPGERLAEEARKLAEAVVGQLGEVRQRVVEPLLRKHPEAAAHLGAAGFELMAAYRSFVADKERRWASRAAPAQRVDLDAPDDEPRGT